LAEEDSDGSDDEYGMPRGKPKAQDKRRPPHSEVGRANRHTLDENLEQMMSGSFDVSFPSNADGGQRGFSPGMDAGFDFGDSEDFGFCDISNELAKELGEGWTSAPFQPKLVLFPRRRGEVHVILSGLPRGQRINLPSVLSRQT
jgi:meiotic recombination protein REC8